MRIGFLPDMAFDRERTKGAVAKLAARGVFIGTSSWKYPGWRGQLYDGERYATRGKFSESRFNRDCLAEYAEVFKTVCVDAAYYKFPDQRYLEGMVNAIERRLEPIARHPIGVGRRIAPTAADPDKIIAVRVPRPIARHPDNVGASWSFGGRHFLKVFRWLHRNQNRRLWIHRDRLGKRLMHLAAGQHL